MELGVGKDMMGVMFCPKCGSADQKAESYCRQCGEWLPDIDAATQPRLFRKRTRQEKLGKMRILEVVSAALACTSAAIIFSVLSGSGDTSLLNLAGICCLLIAIYQAVNFYFGYSLQPKRNRNQVQESRVGRRAEHVAAALDSCPEVIEVPTVTDNTTELLRPSQRDDQHKKVSK
jgi:hypothetical protein